jgi:hypothetical protein
MAFDSFDAEPEPIRDVARPESLGDEPKYLDLTRCELAQRTPYGEGVAD